MLSQEYVYEDLIIELKFGINYDVIGIYRDCVKVHESINYPDGITISRPQILIKLIEMVMGEPFDLEKLELVKTEYIDD